MNWDAIGAIAELLGAVAVVASLIYLATQIRQSTRATQGASLEFISKLSIDFLVQVASDAETASIFRRGLTESEQLNADELLRFDMLIFAVLESLDATLAQRDRGMHTDADFQKWDKVIGDYMAHPGVRSFWSRSSENFSPAFRQYVAEIEPGRRWEEYDTTERDESPAGAES